MSEDQKNDSERDADALAAHVRALAAEIGERHLHKDDTLQRAADYITTSWEGAGLEVKRQQFAAGDQNAANLLVEFPGQGDCAEIVLFGAHYDTVPGSPGANDNGSGVAALLELGRRLQGCPLRRRVRLVAFANEEPPYYRSDWMGSMVHARAAREQGEKITAMFSLETIGYYSDEPDSQKFPAPLLGRMYPDTGNFIAFVTHLKDAFLLRRALDAFRRAGTLPVEGLTAPAWVPGIDWSDHWSFWQQGYPALMITDTAPYRYPWYHSAEDTPEKLDYPRLARLVAGLDRLAKKMAD